jgi:DNA-binding protein HU-beta
MTKKDFIEVYAAKGNFETKAEAERKLNSSLDLFEEVLVKGDDINFVGWGKFEVRETLATTKAINITIPQFIPFSP